LCILLTPALLHAAEAAPAPTWHAQSLGQALLYMLLFAGVGIVAAIAGYKIFDKCTPGHLNKEILEHRNVAAAIIAGGGDPRRVHHYRRRDAWLKASSARETKPEHTPGIDRRPVRRGTGRLRT
jgi:hypothetical protein